MTLPNSTDLAERDLVWVSTGVSRRLSTTEKGDRDDTKAANQNHRDLSEKRIVVLGISQPSPGETTYRGRITCMGLNAISEFGQQNAGVTRIIRNAARVQRKNVMRVLNRAKKQSALSSDADLNRMPDFFDCTLGRNEDGG